MTEQLIEVVQSHFWTCTHRLKISFKLFPRLTWVEWDQDWPCGWWWGRDMGWQRHKLAAEINPVHASHTHCSRAYATHHATVKPPIIADISLTIVFFHTITSGFYVIHVYCTCVDVAIDCQKWYLTWCKEDLSLLYTFNWHWLGIYSYLSKSMVFHCFSLIWPCILQDLHRIRGNWPCGVQIWPYFWPQTTPSLSLGLFMQIIFKNYKS